MKTFVSFAAVSLSVPVLGLAADVPLPDVSNLTATAMLGWYAWHTASRTIPDLVANFRAELAAARDDHRAAVECLCHELRAHRESRDTHHRELLSALEGIASRPHKPE
jgi:hypothetical protein